jgi:hypothetical protein
MNLTQSPMGRRHFLIAAGVTSTSALILKKLTGIIGPDFKADMAMASDKGKTEDIKKMNNSEKFKMPEWVIDEVLSPGYGPREIGYQQLDNGDALVCTYARFENCNGKILDWWMADYLKGTKEYQLWHQDHTTLEWDESKKPGTFINATHKSGEYIGGQFIPMWISFYDPSEILGMSSYSDKTISSVACVSIWLKDKKLFASLIQVIRDTYYGCEMRLRFNAINMKAANCAGLMQHSMEEMANLAGFLPALYAREHQRKANNPAM